MSEETISMGAATRAEAARVVHAVVAEGRSLDALLVATDQRTDPSERSLLRALCYGVLRFHWRLSAELDALLSKPLKSRDRILRSLLAVGIYQLSDTRVSQHAAVTLTVDATRLLNRPKAAGLVNAILRNYLRGKSRAAREASDEARWDHPRWIIEQLRTDWPNDWQQILSANNQQAPMWLRVNARRQDAASYIDRLSAPAAVLPGIDHAIRLETPQTVDSLPGFSEGDVSVQDGAAQIAAPWLLQQGGRRLLDICAAPGGKAAQLLELAEPGATLTAVDIDSARSARIDETLQRLGLTAQVNVADAADESSWWDGKPFDRILLDAPCSASGVIRRHPDIKHLRRRSDLDALAMLQGTLLDTAWRLLEPGGRLLYVTCSVFSAENDAAVAGFLARHPDAKSIYLLPNNNIQALMVRREHGFQVLPGSADLDGFFFACMDKQA